MNNFNIEVCFNKVPLQPYEWETSSILTKGAIKKVPTKCLEEIMLCECKINYKAKTLIISDAKTSVALRLDNEGYVVSRSFLSYSDDISISEYAQGLTLYNLKYNLDVQKINYLKNLVCDEYVKKSVIEKIKKLKDEYKKCYLYFLCFGELKNYSFDNFLQSLENLSVEKYRELSQYL